jgi:hypothetical protein
MLAGAVAAQERLPWGAAEPPRTITPYDDRRRDWESERHDRQAPPYDNPPVYREPPERPAQGAYERPFYDRPGYATGREDAYRPPQRDAYRPQAPVYGAPYGSVPSDEPYERRSDAGRYRYDPPPHRRAEYDRQDGTFSMREILDTGHSFFGSLSQGLASVVEHAFSRQGRPNGYILGEDLGGAFVAGLRYGEGALYTRDAGTHKVYWQGPSLGFDAGADGTKVMVLVYNLRDPAEIYERFGGVEGSAYVVGGFGLTFQSHNHVVLAPIRTGIGLRLGANIGYLKYTRRPTWNPF